MTIISAKLAGAVVALAVIGGMQFEVASGQALMPSLRNTDATNKATQSIVYDVNRAAKADRHALAASPVGETTAVSNYLSEPATTVAIRVKPSTPPQSTRPAAKKIKHPVACEGVVSVLAEVARQLQPGRCIT